MGTTFEQSSAMPLASIKVDQEFDDVMETESLEPGFKRHYDDDDVLPVESIRNATNTHSEIQENNNIDAKKCLEQNWTSGQQGIQEEVEILATAEALPVVPTKEPSKQSPRTKEQQAQLPKPLKEGLKHLKNLLKLPKARQWVYCEYFYSDIDRELLLGENEFRQCLRESFPNLKTRQLKRAEWRQVRRLIGRPRRCSPAFFASERLALEARRSRIRQVYRGETLTFGGDEIDIPLKIPKALTAGEKVCVRIRDMKDGIYAGTIDAVMDGFYRIIFDKNIMVPLVVPDFEVMGESHDELVAVSFLLENNKAIQQTQFRSNGTTPVAKIEISPAKNVAVTGNDPILTSVHCQPPSSSITPSGGHTFGASAPGMGPAHPPTKIAREERCGHYPLRLVVMLVKLAKVMDKKKILIAQVQEMNREAERMHLYTEGYVRKFQDRYAKTVLELERVNKTLQDYLIGVSEYVGNLLPQLSEITVTSRPEALHKFCQVHASQIVNTSNQSLHVRNRGAIHLVTRLTSLLLQLRALGQQQCNAVELHSLRRCIDEIKASLDAGNREDFEDNVEVHIKQIEFSMQGGDTASLAGFMDYPF